MPLPSPLDIVPPDMPVQLHEEPMAQMDAPATKSDALALAGYFSPKGDPYAYRIEGGNVRFYNKKTGNMGRVSLQKIQQDNPDWYRRNVEGDRSAPPASPPAEDPQQTLPAGNAQTQQEQQAEQTRQQINDNPAVAQARSQFLDNLMNGIEPGSYLDNTSPTTASPPTAPQASNESGGAFRETLNMLRGGYNAVSDFVSPVTDALNANVAPEGVQPLGGRSSGPISIEALASMVATPVVRWPLSTLSRRGPKRLPPPGPLGLPPRQGPLGLPPRRVPKGLPPRTPRGYQPVPQGGAGTATRPPIPLPGEVPPF